MVGHSVRTVLAVLALSAGMISAAVAQEDCRSSAKEERDLVACLGKLTRAQTAEMTTAVGTLKKRYTDPSEKGFAPLVDRAQRQWMAWRDAECALRNFESRQGSGYATILLTCTHELNAERVKILKDMVDSP